MTQSDRREARNTAKHVLVNAGLMLVMMLAHVVASSWLLLTSLGMTTVLTDRLPTGGVAGWFWSVWAVAGLVWTPMNARGLWKREPWARTSTLYYWIASIPLCCCIPTGLYGIWSMRRPTTRALFEDAETPLP